MYSVKLLLEAKAKTTSERQTLLVICFNYRNHEGTFLNSINCLFVIMIIVIRVQFTTGLSLTSSTSWPLSPL